MEYHIGDKVKIVTNSLLMEDYAQYEQYNVCIGMIGTIVYIYQEPNYDECPYKVDLGELGMLCFMEEELELVERI